ncbi:MAG: fimbrillin family protein [Dysgonamonadaceae bacterium]|jgi:hypothetical protein|nr:fimbrillin family protein [Dysgonamonadaceae bacterium]
MNTIKKEISMGRYVCCLSIAVLLLCGLILLLSSCIREVGGESGEGNIKVNFTLSDVAYGEGEKPARAYGATNPESETVIVPVEGDLYMYATLEAIPDAPLRGLEQISVGNRVMIAAYDNNWNLVQYQGQNQVFEYKITNIGIAPVNPANYIRLNSAGTYHFVAYSINAASVPAYANYIYVSPDDDYDLLWGHTNATVVEDTEGNANHVTIAMRHKFAQVTVKATTAAISTAPVISAIEDTYIQPGYSCEFDLKNGTMSYEEDPDTWGPVQAWQPVTWPSPITTPNATITATPRLVYTWAGFGSDPIEIQVASMTIGGKQYGPLSAKFNMQLQSGYKYTLSLDFKGMVFAASNIYWDGSKLTFDTDYTKDNMMKQGVFFRYGSLVGVSPALTNGDRELVVGTASDSLTTGTRIYVPYWDGTNRNWTKTNVAARGWYSNEPTYPFRILIDIPYGSYGGSGDPRYSNYAASAEYNTVANWKAWKGDICQFINSEYRLPVPFEIGATDGWDVTNWSAVDDLVSNIDFDLGSEDGKACMLVGVKHKISGYILPASGNRNDNGGASPGMLTVVNGVGEYRTTSYKGYGLETYGTPAIGRVHYLTGGSTSTFFPARCVKINP